jgi:hypothetical protein
LAFKIIINAYQNKINELEHKVITLEDTLKSKSQKFSEIEKNLKMNNTNFKDYESTIERLTNENIYLMDSVKKLSEENKILMKYKTNALMVNEEDFKEVRERDLRSSQMSSGYRFGQSDNIDALMGELNANNYRDDLSVCSNSSTKAIEKRIMEFKSKLKEGTYGRKSPELYKSNSRRINEVHEYSPRSNQFLLSSRFFNQCKMALNKNDYDMLIDMITHEREDLHERVNDLLCGHPDLISDFKILFKY